MTDLTASEIEPSALVQRATKWALALVQRAEHLGAGGRDRAIHTAARWANVTPNTIWSLLYRKPQEVGASTYFRLRAAYRTHIESVEAKVAENYIALKALPPSPSRDRLVADMAQFLGIAPGEEARTAAERT